MATYMFMIGYLLGWILAGLFRAFHTKALSGFVDTSEQFIHSPQAAWSTEFPIKKLLQSSSVELSVFGQKHTCSKMPLQFTTTFYLGLFPISLLFSP
jgi:hypothetical protein